MRAQREVQYIHCAAIHIQAFYQMQWAHSGYQVKKAAVAILQKYYRVYSRVQMEKTHFLAMQISVQSL